ncbi:MAG: helix-turn-helix transcriptional regulator [Alphaproteobacteria bacterium]|nr:helix-turn-helix transcriptional regulator [Alphaproteobacteria bacterium]
MFKQIEFKDLGNLIYKRRKSRKITQENLAMISGLGIRFIREVEKGKPTSQIEKVFLMLHYLGIDLYYFEQEQDKNL